MLSKFERNAGNWYWGFLAYMVVGSVLGVVSWALQIAFKFLLSGLGMRVEFLEALTVVLAFALMGLVGFLTHRQFVFRSRGSLTKFYFAGACIIFAVAALTAAIAGLLRIIGAADFNLFAYPAAAVLISPVSYLFKRHWVYPVAKSDG